jgi:hypothetical protein
MPTDQRHPTLKLPPKLSPPKARRALAASISLTAMLVAAALWASADSAAAMNLRAFGGSGDRVHRGQVSRGQVPRGQVSRDQVYRGPVKGRVVGRVKLSGAAWRRVGSRDDRPRVGGDNPPRHPVWPRWPHRPVIGGLPLIPLAPFVPTAPVSLANVPPSGPIGPPAAGAGGGAPVSGVPAASERRFVADEVLVSFAGNLSQQAIVGFAQGQRLALLGVHRLPLINTVLYRFRITDRRAVPAVVGGLQGDARIGAAQPNYLYTLQDMLPDAAQRTGDPAQYVVAKLHLPEAHAFATGGRALVAVIDSAIDAAHPELKGAVVGSFDTIKSLPLPHEHGTAMASAIVAHGRLVGVAPAAHILAVRAFDGDAASAQAATTRVLDGLQWTADSGARIVNMSFTGPADPKLHEMIASARKKGLVLIAAAGNDGPQASPDYPAAYPEVIAVTATDVDDKLLKVANRGQYVSVAAPGVDIMVAKPKGAYGFTTGTSVATAHVSGLAALLIDRNPALTPDQVQAILMRTAKDLGPKGRDDEFGAGLVDAYEALLTLAPATAEQNVAR